MCSNFCQNKNLLLEFKVGFQFKPAVDFIGPRGGGSVVAVALIIPFREVLSSPNSCVRLIGSLVRMSDQPKIRKFRKKTPF